MLLAHFFQGVLVAPVARVATVVVVGVASRALGVVVAVQYEPLVVGKGGGFPVVLDMARLAVALVLTVQVVARPFVAPLTTIAHHGT